MIARGACTPLSQRNSFQECPSWAASSNRNNWKHHGFLRQLSTKFSLDVFGIHFMGRLKCKVDYCEKNFETTQNPHNYLE